MPLAISSIPRMLAANQEVQTKLSKENQIVLS